MIYYNECIECHKPKSKNASPRHQRCTGYTQGLKKCTICKGYQPTKNFTRNKTNWDGLEHYCKQCNVIKFHSYYQRNKERCRQIIYKSIRKHWEKQKARQQAKCLGFRQCEVENCLKLGEKHHDDYSKPLEVRWLCKRHHAMVESGGLLTPR